MKKMLKRFVLGTALLGLVAVSVPMKVLADDPVPATEKAAEENPSIDFKVKMNNVKGYEPKATDSFTVTFTQIANDVKYWGKTNGNPDAADVGVIAPALPVKDDPTLENNTLTPASVSTQGTLKDGALATSKDATIASSTKVATVTFSSFKEITQPGIYTFRVESKVDDGAKASWTPEKAAETYILKVKAIKDDTKLKYVVNVLNSDGTKIEDKGQDEGIVFNYTLNERKRDVNLAHMIAGDIGTIPQDRPYKVKVTITKPDYSNTSTFTIGDGPETITSGVEKELTFTPSEDKTIKDVPVGSIITIKELETDNPNALGNDKIQVLRGTTDEDTATEKVDGTLGTGVTATDLLVTEDKDTGNDTTENKFTVKDTYKDIINTGLSIATSPFALLLAIVTAALGTYIYLKRRVRQ